MNTCKNNTYVDKTDLNVGQFFFMLLGMIPFAIFCPAWIVARFIYIPFYHLYIPYKKSLFEIEVNSKNKTLSKWFYGNSDKVNKFKTFQNYLEHL